MEKVKHWLYGEDKRKVIIDKEDDCTKCIHKKVCARDMEHFCENYLFGNSEHTSCGGCSNRYPRYDERQPIPCLKCKFYQEE